MVAAAASFTANTYEEARNQRLEENKRKFQDLGISTISKTLSDFTATPKKSQQRIWKPKSKNASSDVKPRRSSRQRNPVQSYRDDVDIGLPALMRRSRSTSSSLGSYLVRPLEGIRLVSYEERNAAIKAAEKLQENLQTENPSFVKSMVRSHVYSCFWLGLPSKFCEDHLSKAGSEMVLEDEEGNEYDAIYIGKRSGLSGGWRGFALEHKLDDGDALVFELTEPARFKIYIVKATPTSSLERCKNIVDKEDVSSAEKTSKAAMKPDLESNQKRRSKRGAVPEVDQSPPTPESESNHKRRSTRGSMPVMDDSPTSLDPELNQRRRSTGGAAPAIDYSKGFPDLEPNKKRRSGKGVSVPEMDESPPSPEPESNQKRRSKKGAVPEVDESPPPPEPESNQKRRSKRGSMPVMDDSQPSLDSELNHRRRSTRGAAPAIDYSKGFPDPEPNKKQRSGKGAAPDIDDSKSSLKLQPELPKSCVIEKEVSPAKMNDAVPKKLGKKAKANRARNTESPEGYEVEPEESTRFEDENECAAKKPRRWL